MESPGAAVGGFSVRGQPVRSWLPQTLLLVYLAVTLAVFVAQPVLAFPRSAPQLWAAFLAGLVYLISAIWTFSVRRSRPAGQALTLFSASLAMALAGLGDLFGDGAFAGLWALALGVASGAAFDLAFLFPREEAFLRQRRGLLLAGFAPGLALTLAAWLSLGGVIAPGVARAVPGWQAGWLCLMILFCLAWIALRQMRTAMATEREQARLAIFGGVISYGPWMIWLGVHLANGRPVEMPPPAILLPLAIFPALAGYLLQRFRLQQADFIFSRAILYGALAILTVAGYALLVAGLSLLAGRLVGQDNPVLTGVIFFLFALAIHPLRAALQRRIDAAFFRSDQAHQERVAAFSNALTHVVDLGEILATLRRTIQETLAPGRMHLFLLDPLSDTYEAAADETGAATSDVRFNSSSPLIQTLAHEDSMLIMAGPESLPPSFQADRARLTLLGTKYFVPLPGRERLNGWVTLGERFSGEPYTSRDLNFLETLCDQAALAIERAQVLTNMQNRVHQLNVLARVAQGVNITLSMDDLLELIYAQSTQIIPSDRFSIMLYDRVQDVYRYAFYLEKDERLSEHENRPIPPGQALEVEVIRQGRPLRTEDFNRECQRLGVAAPRSGLYAWMAVPLNAGAETIGALSMGSEDPRIAYTADQQNLAQAIADQVAGAIVKARLLQETERRALQLTTLNEMTRQLTSTLDLEPLLMNILQSAVDILTCEAGSLLLVDEVTEELVFRVVVSPVANDLLNRRLPPGSGVVGKAVKTRQPIIVNDVSRSAEWYSKTDQTTGFVTRALLVIPLIVKDRVIGVIEVINKRDGSPFTQDDEDLLSAFAAQSAVAIENARLYTLTDQALAARVEELSVMQRIDRELNTSLDTSRAMRITLEWAMRQSRAQAGLIGIVQDEHLKVMASQGYSDELEAHPNGLLPVKALGLEEALQEAAPFYRRLDGTPEDPRRLLKQAASQAIVPIRREGAAIGLLLLESDAAGPLSEETLGFLARLSDHASVAIFNAQLYHAVQSANLAKSEFVSFVAHELKNPMTSVKGYTELLAAGAVGPVNEAQTNFLSTIRANIERMNTLVSDLNDLSKIEVGRLRLDFKAISVAEVVDSVVRSTRRQIEEKKQELTLDVPATLPPAWADRTRFEQVLVNLISNAHKYTPAGGHIHVAAEQCPNRWDEQGAPQVIHIWVKDDGIGISEEDQKKIFQKFFRSEDPKTREAPGTGLGLNITRSLVEMQGGKIWFESEFRKGTTFHFTVPVSAQ